MEATNIATTLPVDLLLEIVARTDFLTVVRCAAVCKHLRRDILSALFIHRFSQQAASTMLAHCPYDMQLLNPVHPATSAAAHFCHSYLTPCMSRHAANLFGRYYPVTSRGGLAVLGFYEKSESERSSGLCVYDPMTGRHTILSRPTGDLTTRDNRQAYVLLTAADGIDCSFKLLFISVCEWGIKVQAATSSSGTWRPLTSHVSHPAFPWMHTIGYNTPAILRGGIIHWLVYYRDKILTYDVGTGAPGRVKLPPTIHNQSKLHLATSLDGNLLKLLAIEGFKISVWRQLPAVTASCGWSLENVIDIEHKLRLVCPDIPHRSGDVVVDFEGSGKRSGDVLLLQVYRKYGCTALIVLDLHTKEMHTHKWGFSFWEINLSSHLETMKVFS
ncbi:hypothetical protein VPH35_140819 [Triticum aestivum]